MEQVTLEACSLAITANVLTHLKLDVGLAGTVNMMFAQLVVNLQCLTISVRKDIQRNGARMLQNTLAECSRAMSAGAQTLVVKEDGFARNVATMFVPSAVPLKLFPTRNAVKIIHWLGAITLRNIQVEHSLVMAARVLIKQVKEDGHVIYANTIFVKSADQVNPIPNARRIILWVGKQVLLVILVACSLVMDARNQANVEMEDGFARRAHMIFAQDAEVLKLIQTVRVDIFWLGQLML